MSEEDFADNVCRIRLVQIREIMVPIVRPEIPIPGKIYRQLGVKLWGQGAYEREAIEGSQTKYKTLSMVQENDIVVNKIWARNGAVAVVPKDLSGCFVSGEFPIFSPVLEKLEPRWFHWLTKTNAFWRKCDEKSQGTSGKNRIRPEKFLEIEIPLPPVLEQRRIVARIEELAARIEEARELRRRAVEETDIVLSSYLESIFEIKCNKKWTMKKLIDDHRAIVIAGQHILAGDYNSLREGTPYLTGPADFGQRIAEIKHWTNIPKTLAFPGDILITVKGAGVGKINFAPNSQAAIGRQLMAIRPNQEHLLKEFVYFFLLHRFKHFQSIATATTVPGFKKSDLETLEIPKVPIYEQTSIVCSLDILQSKLDLLKRHQAETAAALDALLPAVLEQAFLGEL